MNNVLDSASQIGLSEINPSILFAFNYNILSLPTENKK